VDVALDEKVSAPLVAACEQLAGAAAFSYSADELADVIAIDGGPVQIAGTCTVTVRRPDALKVEARIAEGDVVLWFADGRVTVLDRKANRVAGEETRADLDGFLDHMAEEYDLSLPAADFLYTDPLSSLLGEVESGRHVGVTDVKGQRCHHLAFRQPLVTWEVWLTDTDAPLPARIVIRDDRESLSRFYEANLADWKLLGEVPATHFEADVPEDATRVSMHELLDPVEVSK
jgi:hypothetical protein